MIAFPPDIQEVVVAWFTVNESPAILEQSALGKSIWGLIVSPKAHLLGAMSEDRLRHFTGVTQKIVPAQLFL